jgi:hypothetical protein
MIWTGAQIGTEKPGKMVSRYQLYCTPTTDFFELKSILVDLKGQCHEIFDLWFIHQTITRPQMNTLKYFRICWEINENVLIPRYAA